MPRISLPLIKHTNFFLILNKKFEIDLKKRITE